MRHVACAGLQPSSILPHARTWQGLRFKAVDDPNYLSPTVAERARDLASQLIAQDTDEGTYWRGTDLMSLFGLYLPNDVPGRLYVVWGNLTDIWELHPERRTESAALMREAAREFLVLSNTTTDVDAYLTRWYERLGEL